MHVHSRLTGAQCWLLVFVQVFFSRVITLALALYLARRVTVMETLLKSVDSLKKAHRKMSTKLVPATGEGGCSGSEGECSINCEQDTEELRHRSCLFSIERERAAVFL